LFKKRTVHYKLSRTSHSVTEASEIAQ